MGVPIWLIWPRGDHSNLDCTNVPYCYPDSNTYSGCYHCLRTYLGSLILFAAIFLAFSFGYFLGRYFGPVIVEKLIGPRSEKKISSFIDDYGFWTVIVIRLRPFLSNDAISFVGGVLKMGYWKFMGATILGISPLIIFIAYLGGDYERLKTGLIWTSGISLILFIALCGGIKQREGTNPEPFFTG